MEMLELQVAFGNASITAKEQFIFYNFYLIQDSKKLTKKFNITSQAEMSLYLMMKHSFFTVVIYCHDQL